MSYSIIKFDKTSNKPTFDVHPVDSTCPFWHNRGRVVFTEVHAGYMITNDENIFNAKRQILREAHRVAKSEADTLQRDTNRLRSFEHACAHELEQLGE